MGARYYDPSSGHVFFCSACDEWSQSLRCESCGLIGVECDEPADSGIILRWGPQYRDIKSGKIYYCAGCDFFGYDVECELCGKHVLSDFDAEPDDPHFQYPCRRCKKPIYVIGAGADDYCQNCGFHQADELPDGRRKELGTQQSSGDLPRWLTTLLVTAGFAYGIWFVWLR